MENKRYFRLIILVVFLLGFVLRFYKLGFNPPSLNWDEASIGYNAYSILETGKDEYGAFLPLEIRSFGDYKPSLYIYLTVPFIAFFGLTEFAVRFIAALLGSFTVIVAYFLTREFMRVRTVNAEYTALISAFLLAVSPWHLQFSRAAYEGNIGLFFFMLAALFYLQGLAGGKKIILSSVFFILSVYSYHSFRLLVPLYLILLSIIFFNSIIKRKKIYVLFLVLILISYLPIFRSFYNDRGSSARLSMVTIFSGHDLLEKSIKDLQYDLERKDYLGALFHNRRLVYLKTGIQNYLDHWNPNFLFIYGDGGRQHHAVDMGMIYLWELPFILIGSVVLVTSLNRKKLAAIVWLLLAPLPASITTGTPHPVRAIAMLPIIHILTAFGIVGLVLAAMKLKSKMIRYFSFFIMTASFIINFTYYLHQYYIHTPLQYGDFWQYGYKELFNYLAQVEDNYDKIIITYRYDQPYIYYLFYNKIDPNWYQSNWDYLGNGEVERMRRMIGKYEFRNIDWNSDRFIRKTLIAGTESEIPEKVKKTKEIQFLDGSTAFFIAESSE